MTTVSAFPKKAAFGWQHMHFLCALLRAAHLACYSHAIVMHGAAGVHKGITRMQCARLRRASVV